jgi:hypothetical protein
LWRDLEASCLKSEPNSKIKILFVLPKPDKKFFFETVLTLLLLLLAPMLLQVFPNCCWPCCYWHPYSFPVHALAGAVANVSVVALTVTGVHDHALIHDVGGIYAVASVSFDAGVSSAAGPAVTGVHTLSLSMLLLVLLPMFLLLALLLLASMIMP